MAILYAKINAHLLHSNMPNAKQMCISGLLLYLLDMKKHSNMKTLNTDVYFRTAAVVLFLKPVSGGNFSSI